MRSRLRAAAFAAGLACTIVVVGGCRSDRTGSQPGSDAQGAPTAPSAQGPAKKFGFDDCDIDIRPVTRTGPERVHVEYDSVSDGHMLWITAVYADGAGTTDDVHLHDDAGHDYGKVSPRTAKQVMLTWSGGQRENVQIVSGATTYTIASRGTYNNAERASSPCFEQEDPGTRPGEWIVIRFHFKGRTTTLHLIEH